MTEEKYLDLAELFKVFADSTRLKLLSALLDKELCVCDLAEKLSMTQSAVSHQLNLLRRSKLVKTRREGKSVFYSLDDSHVCDIISCGMEHINEGDV